MPTEPTTSAAAACVPERYSALERAAFLHGWDDRKHGRSDFVRRGYSFESGERQAYMAGRVAFRAEKALVK